MKMIYKIAKTELKNLFYSPIAWFLIIAFMITCAKVYLTILDNCVISQEMGGIPRKMLSDLTSKIFSGQGGLFSTVMSNLYLFMPLLTMGLISREINSGTIKLLYSSPVKIRDIVFGKYLAMMIFSLVLVAIVAIFMVSGFFHIVALDYGMLISAALGLYLLLCAYGAIGLFMSSLSTYQVVAAISSFLMIGLLSYIGGWWQDIDFVRDLTYFLSLYGRTEKMLNGLITTKDLVYFIIIVYMFLAFTIFKLKSGRESKSAWIHASRYFAVVCSALAFGYFSSRPAITGYLDTTRDQKMTLSVNAQKIVNDLGKDELEVTLYTNLLDVLGFIGQPALRNRYLGVWESYTRFKPNISFKYVDYYDEPTNNRILESQYPGKSLDQKANLYAKNSRLDLNRYLRPAEIHKVMDLAPEYNRIVMHMKYKDKTTFLRFYNDELMYPDEPEISAAFKRLLSAKFPKISFVNGNLERDINRSGDRDYQYLTNTKNYRNSLVNQGFDTDTLSLETQDIDPSVSAVVISDPKRTLTALTTSKIQEYIANGGNMLIAGEPGKQDNLNPLLKQLGVQLMPGSIVSPDRNLSQDLSRNTVTAFAATFSKILAIRRADGLIVSMPGATAVAYDSNGAFKVRPLLFTDGNKSWLRKNKYVVDSANVAFSAAGGDIRNSFPTVVALTRTINGREQRIIVSGDADFMSNTELRQDMIPNCNFEFSTALFSWLSYGEFPIDTFRPESKDKSVKLSTSQMKFTRIIYLWILPGLVLAFAFVLLIRRKRK